MLADASTLPSPTGAVTAVRGALDLCLVCQRGKPIAANVDMATYRAESMARHSVFSDPPIH